MWNVSENQIHLYTKTLWVLSSQAKKENKTETKWNGTYCALTRIHSLMQMECGAHFSLLSLMHDSFWQCSWKSLPNMFAFIVELYLVVTWTTTKHIPWKCYTLSFCINECVCVSSSESKSMSAWVSGWLCNANSLANLSKYTIKFHYCNNRASV